MAGVEGDEQQQRQGITPEPPPSRSMRVRQRVNTRGFLLSAAAVVGLLLTVALVLYFKPGSTAEPTGKPALDVFAAGPPTDFPPGTMTRFEKEHFFLVHLDEDHYLALYDLSPQSQARVQAGDLDALKCRAVVRKDAQMVAWLAAAHPPPGFADRGIWDQCSGTAWDASGTQIWGPANGSLDRFPAEVIDQIIRVDLAARDCTNPISPEAPCIETQ
jgi:hypothetical protein